MEAATGDEDLAATAAATVPGAVRAGLLWPGQVHLPAPSPVPGADHQAELCSLLTEPAERVPWADLPWGGHLGATCQVAGEEVCAGWLHSAPEVLWMGRIVAGSAFVLQSGPLEE